MNRTLVVGDIHGGFKALKQVLSRAKVTPQDTLIFLGDYVDGWSESVEVVSFLIHISKTNPCIFLRGNHDDLCHRWLIYKEKPEQWLLHGGQSAIDSYEKISKKEKTLHCTFFENMVNFYQDKNRLFVHAGFQNLNGPGYEFHKTAFFWDRTLWEMAVATDKSLSPQDIRYPKRLLLFKEIYIGHTPVTRIGKSTPTQAQNVWNMDTGAAFKGTISMMDIDTKEFWQSDPVFQLYPEEEGRN
ncbi:MAG: serine/threonine protein phosphatase [Bacteroidetes bacterium HGW-Bacteroidetes-2]|jgi:serine/threonine protein phosphatase 1|nr:MAG: serine/threonine protein phosphatase [Bacteroidetes bacterium HGW-Bacteroidetes-2]